jgi:hypothetical protein
MEGEGRRVRRGDMTTEYVRVKVTQCEKHLTYRCWFSRLMKAGVCTQQPGVRQLGREVEGGKLHGREGKTHLPHKL